MIASLANFQQADLLPRLRELRDEDLKPKRSFSGSRLEVTEVSLSSARDGICSGAEEELAFPDPIWKDARVVAAKKTAAGQQEIS